MRRTALISQFYAPEPCAAANRVGAMARALAEAGNAVRVYTGMPSFPAGVIDAAYRGRGHAVEADGSVVVERVATLAPGPSVPGNRLAVWGSTALGIARRIIAVRERFDVIVVSSPPVTLALPALAAAFAHRAPLVVDVRDVFPDVAIRMGAWKAGSPIANAVGAVADALYARASLITCVTPSAREEILARGVAPERVLLAPNGFDTVEPARDPRVVPCPNVRDIVYVGNMGLATGLDVVLDAAVALRADSSVRFVLIGGGADEARLRARARDERLGNVLFTGTLARADALRALADAALTVVPLVAGITDSIPTKMFDAMLVGTPIVLSADGEAQRLLERSEAGLVARAGDAGAVVAAVHRLLDDDALYRACAERGPAFVRANYDRAAVMSSLAARLEALSVR